MSSYITGFANTAAEWAAWANNNVQDMPYGVGRVWSAGRDWLVLPGAALASKAWTSVQPYASRAVTFTLANKGIVTGLALAGLTALVLGRIYFAPASLEKQLAAAKKEVATQTQVVADLAKTAFGEGKPALVDAALTDEIEARRLAADGKDAESPEFKAHQAIVAYATANTKLGQLQGEVARIEGEIAQAGKKKV
jgi:hypothetical protein